MRIVSVTEDSITIAWNASTDNSGKIHAYVAGGIYHPGNSTTKTFTWLVPNWTQTYRVQAMDAAGNVSALSAPVTGTTAPDLTPPTAPANLRITGSTPSSVSLAWDRATDRWSFAYRLFVDGVEAARDRRPEPSGCVTSHPARRTPSPSGRATIPATPGPRATR